MPGIFSRLGSFGQGIIKRVVATGRTILETVGFLKPMVPEVTESEVARQYGRVQVEASFKGPILDLNPRTIIPESLHTPTDIPFKRKYAYKAIAFGRYVAGTIRDGVKVGGRFAREEYDLPTNRQLTKEEAEDMARGRIGKKGGSPIMEVFSIEIVAAYFREET